MALPSDTISAPINTDFPDEHLFYITSDDPWYDDLLVYLRTQKFGNHLSRDDRRRIRHQAPRYLLIGDILYWRGVDTILRRCLTIDEANRVLNDCHSGACGVHLSGISTAQKIIRAGYFWPTLFDDCIHAVKQCEQCQLYANKARAPPTLLHPVITAGPFCKWGIDFMTCNPPSSNGHKYIVFAIDYFTKWVMNLVIARESVHKGESLVAGVVVDNLMDERRRKVVFGTCVIEIVKVYANMDSALFFVDGYRVGNP
jgi:hypothetical protein